jgi:hypothetical protein
MSSAMALLRNYRVKMKQRMISIKFHIYFDLMEWSLFICLIVHVYANKYELLKIKSIIVC